eukprot:NODE_31287_length_400_cov_1.216117.p4 GENE.NODE_31287_length_400_cov_1.216117~~NODE_31287_length_400_cov_1.216117.p4  ORF type:complete len:73 (+),score=18.33 NODE_31287_length_400_cov_1.216117:71-289(+)
MSLMELTIPAGAGPGAMLTFQTPSGDVYQAQVPEGLFSGQTFQAQIPDAAPAEAPPAPTKKTKSKKPKAGCC